jgi:hypothetical protein
LYKAAPDGGTGAFMALATSAESFRARAAFGLAGRAAMSRPTFSSAWPPGPASHPGPADVTDATDVTDAGTAPVMLTMRRAPPESAAALRDARGLLKVVFLCSWPKPGCQLAGHGSAVAGPDQGIHWASWCSCDKWG